MHARKRPDLKTSKGSRRVTRPDKAVPHLLTATVVQALQRSAGNAAVTRMLADDGPAVKQAAAHSVLRSAGEPLREPVRAEMEARLEADFSDVRVHTGEQARRAAAELGARAWTSGSHVVIGEGGTDRHTLAHELAHVVQQRRGPVAGTDNGAGLSVSDPSDRFEREAEAAAARAVSRPAGEPPTARTARAQAARAQTAPAQKARVQAAPAQTGPAPRAAVQRMEGFEVEVDKRVKGPRGEKLAGDTDLAKSKKADFTVVSDTRMLDDNSGPYSNIEFVSGAVQVVGTKATAGPDEIDRIVDEIKKVRDDFYKRVNGTTLEAATVDLEVLHGGKDTTLSDEGYTETAGMAGMGDGLYVQYTIGLPLAGMPLLFENYRKENPLDRAPLKRARFRLGQAKQFADKELGIFEETRTSKKRTRIDTDSLDGFFQLYFTQVAAMADYLAKEREEGQIKNQTIFLSRSRLTDAFRLLDKDAQNYLKKNDEAIVSRLAEFQEMTETEGEKLEFRDLHSRKVGELEEINLETYAKSALTGKPEVSQQRVFGGMNEIPPHNVEGSKVIPMEIRAIGNYRKSWDELKAELRKIAGWAQEGYQKDQEIHGPGGSRR